MPMSTPSGGRVRREQRPSLWSDMKKPISAILMGLTLGNGSAVGAEIHLADEIAAIPPKITDVYHCGRWENGNSAGSYRIVYVEFHYGNSLLYVQWIQEATPDDATKHILHTLSIDEFNANDHIELSFGKPECIETVDGIRFNIEAESGHDGMRHVFDLRVGSEFGRYSIKELADEFSQ